MHDHLPHLPPRSWREGAQRSAAGPVQGAPAGPSSDREIPRTVATDAMRRTIAEVWAADAQRRRAAALALGEHVQAEPSPDVLQRLAELRASVGLYVARLRAEGLPPERVLACVKTVVWESESPRGSLAASNELMAQVVRWTIEAYFDEPALEGSPRFF
jgi:hypothetical protein